MQRGVKTGLLFLAIALPCRDVAGQSLDSGKDVLQKARETYSSLKSFQYKGTTLITSEGPMTHFQTEMSFEGKFVAPFKMRMEFKSDFMDLVMVSDGQTLWVFNAATNTYRMIALGQGANLSRGMAGQTPRRS